MSSKWASPEISLGAQFVQLPLAREEKEKINLSYEQFGEESSFPFSY